jgi:hypothetical protein
MYPREDTGGHDEGKGKFSAVDSTVIVRVRVSGTGTGGLGGGKAMADVSRRTLAVSIKLTPWSTA